MRALLACLVVLATVAACGTVTGDPGDPDGEWSEQRISARPGADSPTGLAADGDDVLVTVLDEDATLTSHLSVDGGEFRAGEPVEVEGGGYPSFADPVRLDGTWWLVGTGGMVGTGDDETLAFEPRVLRSDDGLTWTPVQVSGIPAPVDVHEVVAVDGALVAVGDLRNEVDTGGASFEAAVWRSEDGASWSEVALPGVVARPTYRDESVVSHVAVAGDRLVAGGSASGRATTWSSTDEGVSWLRDESAEVHELSSVSGLVADGSTVLLGGAPKGSETGARILVSVDAGATFRAAADQPAADGEGWAPLWAGGGHFFTSAQPGFDLYSDPEVCYADISVCRGGAHADVGYVYASEGGDTWSVVDTADLGVGDELVGLAGTDDGRTAMAHAVRGGLVVHSWTAGAALPEGEAAAGPERVELVTVPEGEDPQPGVRYHAPLYVHCGMDWLYLGETPWQRTDDGPDVETGAGDGPPEDWPLAGQTIFGYATLGEDGTIEYSVGEGEDAEVIATYEQTGATPPGCD
jgi:hypothetical protein